MNDEPSINHETEARSPPLSSVQELLPALVELASIQHDLMNELEIQFRTLSESLHMQSSNPFSKSMFADQRVARIQALQLRSSQLIRWLLSRVAEHP